MTAQVSLFDDAPLGPDVVPSAGPRPPLVGLVRHRLARGAWVDLLPGWLAGSPDLLDQLTSGVAWQAERRPMYDRVVDVPRLLSFYAEGERLPHPDLESARHALSTHYAAELGEPFRTAGLCLYRDGADSVAWHGDTIGRGRTADTLVAIVSLGSPREFLLRPRGGGSAARAIASGSGGRQPRDATDAGHGSTADLVDGRDHEPVRPVTGTGTIRHTLQHGDLIVMGGSCQRTWEHAVPKTSRAVGPRVSIQFRPRGVR